ncbi:MAG: hypothetical protein ACK559_16720, partial [bacterium]
AAVGAHLRGLEVFAAQRFAGRVEEPRDQVVRAPERGPRREAVLIGQRVVEVELEAGLDRGRQHHRDGVGVVGDGPVFGLGGAREQEGERSEQHGPGLCRGEGMERRESAANVGSAHSGAHFFMLPELSLRSPGPAAGRRPERGPPRSVPELQEQPQGELQDLE